MENLPITSIIKTSEQHNNALQEISELMNNVKPNTREGNRLELLTLLVTDYEDKHYPIEDPDPIEMIKYKMKEKGMKQKDLADIIGHESRVSDILNRKRSLSISMIRKISATLNIPASILVQEYQLSK